MNPLSEFNQKLDAVLDEVGKTTPAARPLLVAVSKTKPIDAIAALYREGQRDFAENYVQELTEKAAQAQEMGLSEIRWHFIGHLQTNKVKALMPWVSCIQSVDSLRLAQEIDKRWQALCATGARSGRLPVYLQINIDREDSKSGILPEELPDIARAVSQLPGLELQGLMCIPDPEHAEDGRAFRETRELCRKLGQMTQGKLSMGMSSDYAVALREGSTLIRIGTALFGSRK